MNRLLEPLLNECIGLCIAVFLCNSIFAASSSIQYRVDVSRSSFLIIKGYTNMGTFNCAFNPDILPDKLNVEVTRTDTGCLNFTNLELNLPVTSFNCGNVLMNKDFRNLLKYDEYPLIEWHIVCIDISDLGNRIPSGDTLQVNTNLNIAGVKQNYWIPVEIKKNGNALFFRGSLPVNIQDFKLEPPSKVFGLVNVSPYIEIDFAIEIKIF